MYSVRATLASGQASKVTGMRPAGISTAALYVPKCLCTSNSELFPVAYAWQSSRNSGKYGMKRPWKQGPKPRPSRATFRDDVPVRHHPAPIISKFSGSAIADTDALLSEVCKRSGKLLSEP